MANPTLDAFLEAARPANPGVSDADLSSYWQQTYGGAPAGVKSKEPDNSLPSLERFMKDAKPANPDANDDDLRSYWRDTYGARGAPEKEPGDTWRAVKVSFQQLPQLGYGLAAIMAAAGETMLGEDGLASTVKNWAVKGYEGWGESIRRNSKDTDELDVAWDRAKGGDYGALVDWLQYGVGYVAGQLAQAAATYGVGAAAGKLLLRPAVQKLASGMVAKEAEKLVAKGVAADVAQREAVATVASQAGALAATGAQAFGMEGGEIGGDLAAQSVKEGRSLTGTELARAFGATALAGGFEFAGDMLGLGAITGKLPLGKSIAGAAGVGGRVARGAAGALVAAGGEAGTEYAQTLTEEFGKGNDPFSDESRRQAFNAAALGAVGGAVAGGVGGAMSRPSTPAEARIRATDERTAEQVSRIGTAKTVDEAIDIAMVDGAQGGPMFMSDVNDSVAGGILSSRMEGVGDRAARAARDDAAFLGRDAQIEAQKQRDLQTMIDQRRNIDADAATAASLRAEAEAAPAAAPGQTAMQVAFEKAVLKRMEAMAAAGMFGDPSALNGAMERASAPQEPAPRQPQEAGAAPVSAVTAPATPMSAVVQEQRGPAGGAGATQVSPGGAGQPAAPAAPAAAQPAPASAPARGQPAAVDVAAHAAATSPQNALPEPTEAQKQAGNYTKGHARVAGLDVSIENPAGSKRRPEWPTLKQHYGYVKGSVGMDKDHLDVFVKPGTPGDWKGTVYVVNQKKEDGRPDEHKAMVGFDSREAARAAYLENYTAGWEKNIDSVVPIRSDKFAAWATDKSKAGPAGGFLKSGSPAVRIMGQSVHAMTEKALKAIEAPLQKKVAAGGRLTPKQREQLDAAREELDRRAEERAAKPMSPAEAARREKLKRDAAERKTVDIEKDSLIPAIIKLGGLKDTERMDIIRNDTGNRGIPGVGALFTKRGMEADAMAIELAQYGYLTAEEMDDVDGGVRALKDKVAEEFDGQRTHWSVNAEAPLRERQRLEAEAAEDREKAEAAERAAAGAGLDFAIDPAELAEAGLPDDATTLARDEMAARAEALEAGILERLAMQHDTDDAYWQAVAQFLKEREHAPVRDDAQGDRARQEEGEGSRVPEGDRAPAQAEVPASTGEGGTEEVAPAGGTFPSGAPADRAAYLKESEYEKSLRATYFAGEKPLSSRTTPQTAKIPPVGTWMIDDTHEGQDGREIRELRELDVNDIEISEDTGPEKWADVKRYAEWLLEGKEAPPINVLQHESGTLKVSDHRRLMAAKAAGIDTIKAWVSWSTRSRRHGEPIVGMTYELAKKGNKRLPIQPARDDRKIFTDDARALERIKKELAEERSASRPGLELEQQTEADLKAKADREAAAEKARADEEAAAEAKAKAEGKIADFGEKIGGARKDVWTGFKDELREAMNVDVAAEPLSKSWPAPDYQALLDAGADPWAVAFMHAARDAVPAKPKHSWKLKRWVEQVTSLRDTSMKLANGDLSIEKAKSLLDDMAQKSRGMDDVRGRIELYQLVGHEKSLAGVRIASGSYSIYEGKKFDPPKVIWSVEKKSLSSAFSNWPLTIATGDTKEAALADFKAKYDAMQIERPASKEVTFDVYSKRGEDGYWIGKKIGRNSILLEGPFKTVREARTYKAENNAALVAKLEKSKEIPNERRDTNRPRVGEDMRAGQDVTPQMFAETFSFRGVEFGNWVEQDKRQQDLNDAFDALMDMAAILDVHPKALSLNGELGLAFGARGSGGTNSASAHYERGKVVINLTKKRGAGSLGHEWWHALDNYFSRMREQFASMMTEGRDVGSAERGLPYQHAGAVRKEMVEAFGAVMRAIRGTALQERSAKLDKKRSKEYWTTKPEMSARAFESYLISKLQDQGASNDYLANIVEEATWAAAEKLGWEIDGSYPYPTAGEIPKIRAAFDHFFQTVETRETERGVAMFSRSKQAVYDQTATDAFKRWSNDAPLVTSAEADTYPFKTGEKIVVEAFHGTKRPDRVGVKFLKKRATSGPMAFHTSSPELASRYAERKQDTSLAYEETGYENWFKYKPKGARSTVDIARAWYSLTPEQKLVIAERAPTLRESEDGKVVSLEGNTSGNGSYDHNLKETQRGFDRQGNPLKALVEDWLNSGVLFDREELFLDVLKQAGFPVKEVSFDSPHASHPAVYKNYIAMQKPLVTSDIPQSVKDALAQAANRDRSRSARGGADIWDKNTRTLREWVAAFNEPKNEYVWTSIPDKVTEVLKSLGYDGIVDWSGKGGGDVHPVYVPFGEKQVKSAIGNKGTFGDTNNILFSRTTYSVTPDNRPELAGNGVAMVEPAYWQTMYGQRIFQSKIVADGKHVGFVTLGWKDGKVASLIHIEVAPEHRGNGYAEAAVKSILQHNGSSELHVMSILPEARDFWLKIGTDPFQTETGEDGILTEASYSAARGDQGDSQEGRADSVRQGTDAGVEGGTGAPGFRREGGRQALGLTAQDVRGIIAPVLNGWGNAPTVVVADSMQDTLIPEAVRNEDARQRAAGATGEPEGFIYQGKVYLVASALKSPWAVYRVLFHESLGHFGLRRTFGPQLQAILEDVSRSMPTRVRQKARDYGLDFDNADERMQAAEEVLAELAQTRPNSTIVQRAIAAIRRALRALGIDLKLSQNDIIVNFILPARGFVERGKSGVSIGSREAGAFGRTPFSGPEVATTPLPAGTTTITVDGKKRPALNSQGQPIHWSVEGVRNFWRWFGKSKLVDRSGQPLMVYHGTTEGKITTFITDKNGLMWVTPDREYSEQYARDTRRSKSFAGFKSKVIGLYARAEKPFDLTNLPEPESIPSGIVSAIDDEFLFSKVADGSVDVSELASSEAVVGALRAAGYDSIIGMVDTNLGRVKEIALFSNTQVKSATGNDGTFDAGDPSILSSRAQSPWYSELSRQIEKVGMKASPAKGWQDYLKGLPAKGVKSDEIEWSGLNDWLALQPGKVTKEQVLDFLAQNGVRVEETMLGANGSRQGVESDARRRADDIRVKLDALGYNTNEDFDGTLVSIERRSDGTEFNYESDLSAFIDENENEAPKEVSELAIAMGQALEQMAEARDDVHPYGGNDARYSQYQLPGGENYRELLLTLPERDVAEVRPEDLLAQGWTVTIDDKNQFTGQQNYTIRDPQGEWAGARHGAPASLDTDAKILADWAKSQAKRDTDDARRAANFRSGHFDQPNILAHVRFNERTDADGKRVLFVEEIQSDWAQKGKREGFAVRGQGKEDFEVVQRPDGLWVAENRNDGATVAATSRELLDQRVAEAIARSRSTTGVPAAPFVGKTEAWVGLALKRMIRYAAEHGFDRVAWTTGEQQEERYWGHDLVRPAVLRWNEVTKPQGIRELANDVIGREAATLMPLDAVDGGVLSVLQHDQVRKAVVSLLPVDVVNILATKQFSPEDALGKTDVVLGQLPVDKRRAVALGILNAMRQVSADLSAKLRDLAPGGADVKLLPALNASQLGPREIAALLDPVRLFHGGAGSSPQRGTPTGAGAKPLARGEGRVGDGKTAAAKLASALNAHAEIVHGSAGLVQQAFQEPPGEGMRAFYDKIVPNVANDVLKKLGGGRVASTQIPMIPPSAIDARTSQRVPSQQPGFDITPAMRDKALAGMPMFARSEDGSQDFDGETKFDQIVREFSAKVQESIAADRETQQPIRLSANTPASLQVFGWRDLPVEVRVGKDGLLKMHYDHGMTAEQIGRLIPSTLKRPALVMQHVGQGGVESLRFIAREEKNGKPIMVAVQPENVGAAGKRQLVATMLPLDDGWANVARAINRGSLLYRDTGFAAPADVRSAIVSAQKKFATAPRSLLGLIPNSAPVRQRSYMVLTESALVKWERENWGDRPMFSRSPAIADAPTTGDYRDSFVSKATSFVRDMMHKDTKFNWWHRTVGTQQHKAAVNRSFRPVYDESQAFISDITKYANEAADEALDLLPRIDKFSDFGKKTPSVEDLDAARDALYAGTLWGGGSPLEGRIWTDEELRAGNAVDGDVRMRAFKPLNDDQIKLYRQALSSVSRSMEGMSKSILHKLVRQHGIGFDREMSLEDVVADLNNKIDDVITDKSVELEYLTDEDRLKAEAEQVATDAEGSPRDPDGSKAAAKFMREMKDAAERVQREIDGLEELKNQVADVEAKTKGLTDHGYFPAMRFGRFAVHVVRERNGEQEQLYFGLYESQSAANMAARELAKEYPDARIDRGVMPEQQHRLFQGLSLDALETFADYITGEDGQPISRDPLVQGFLKAATAERSVLKRHIHRKGIAGYSKDMPRVLASFITSTARATSSNYHAAEMLRLANEAEPGDVKDEAIKLVRYLQDPQEEAAGLRGLLFVQYLGGSIAHGLVNMTQPVMVTTPYLTQFTSAADAAAKVAQAAGTKVESLTGAIKEAYARAKKEGVVAPQEIHQLRADAGGAPLGRSLVMRKLGFLWGSIYSVTEQFNRTTSFLAAYRVAEQKGMADPYAFAVNAVNETQFVYNKGARPNWARGPIGATVFTFKQFSISYLELAKRLYSNGREGKKAFALLILMLLVAAGLEGLPFAEDIEDLIDTIGQWMGYATNTKKSLRKWATATLGPDLAQVALKGVSGLPWMPVDVSQRMGMHNLIPGTALLKPSEKDKARDVLEFVGPAGQFLPTEGTMMGRALERIFSGDLFGAAVAAAPVGAQNVLKGVDMLSKGYAVDTKGRKVTNVTPGEAVLKMVGLNPSPVARESAKLSAAQQDINLQKRVESEIAENWARGQANGKPDEVRAAIKKLHDWNRDNPGLRIRIDPSQIRNRVKQMKMSREERFVKTAPKEIRGEVREALR